MFLCLLWPKELPKEKKSKSKAKAGIAKGLNEREKCRVMKETGPINIGITIGEQIQKIVQQTDTAVQGELKGLLEEYKNIFLDKLPYGPPLKRVVDHEIETTAGETPPHKSPHRLSVAE